MLARKVAYNIIVSSAAKVVSTALALVSIGLITRYLGKEGFGNYATVLAFLSLFSAVADLGLYHISTREISRSGADEKKIIGNIFTLRLASSFIMVVIAFFISGFLPYPPEVKRGILIISGSFFFASVYQVLNGVFQKRLSMDKVAIGELVGKVIQVLAVIAAVRWQLGFDWIIASLLFNMAVSFVIIFVWSRKYLFFTLQFNLKYWKGFLREAFPMGMASIITFLYFKLDTILLSVMKNSADVGIYNASYKVLENLNFFPAMIMGLVLPIWSHTVFDNRRQFEETANKTFKLFLVLVIPLLIATLFLAEPIIGIVGGVGFSESVHVLRILVFALVLIFFGHFFNTALIVSNMQKKLMYVFAIAAVCNITLNLAFIPKFSYLAAAYASVFTELLVVAASFYITVTKVKYWPKINKFFGVILSGAGMALVFLVLRESHFVIQGLTAVAVYSLLLWIFNVVTASEISSLITKKGIKEYEELP